MKKVRNTLYHVTIRQMIAMPTFHLKQSIQISKQKVSVLDKPHIFHQAVLHLRRRMNGNYVQPSLTQQTQNQIILHSTFGNTAIVKVEGLKRGFADQWLKKEPNTTVGHYQKKIMIILVQTFWIIQEPLM